MFFILPRLCYTASGLMFHCRPTSYYPRVSTVMMTTKLWQPTHCDQCNSADGRLVSEKLLEVSREQSSDDSFSCWQSPRPKLFIENVTIMSILVVIGVLSFVGITLFFLFFYTFPMHVWSYLRLSNINFIIRSKPSLEPLSLSCV